MSCTRLRFLVLLAAIVLAVNVSAALADMVLLSDDFSGASLDTGKWDKTYYAGPNNYNYTGDTTGNAVDVALTGGHLLQISGTTTFSAPGYVWDVGRAVVSKNAFSLPSSGYDQFATNLDALTGYSGNTKQYGANIGLIDVAGGNAEVLNVIHPYGGADGSFNLELIHLISGVQTVTALGAISAPSSSSPAALAIRLYSDSHVEFLFNGSSVYSGSPAAGSYSSFKVALAANGRGDPDSVTAQFDGGQLTSSVPEPASLVLVGLALGSFVGYRGFRHRLGRRPC